MTRKPFARRPGRPAYPDILTPAEQRVLEQVRLGLPYAEIAVRLGISVNAVKYHVSNMLGKLGLTDRRELARWEPGKPSRRGAGLLAGLWLKWGAGLAASAAGIAGGAYIAGPLLDISAAGPAGGAVVTLAYDGSPADGDSTAPVVSGDGRTVVYTSDATNLVPDDTNEKVDVFVYDRKDGTTTLVSTGPVGQADGDSGNPAVSADGRYVVFDSAASNLGPRRPALPDSDVARVRASVEAPGPDPMFPPETRERVVDYLTSASSPSRQVFLHDRLTGETRQVSVSPAGEGANHDSWGPSISADGRYIAFASNASNLVPDDTNLGVGSPSRGNGLRKTTYSGLGGADVFVLDRVSGEMRRISLTADGREATGDSVSPAISPDGTKVYFLSDAPDLIAGQDVVRTEVGVNSWADPTVGTPVQDRPGEYSGVTRVVEMPLMMPFVHDLRTGRTEQVPLPPETDSYSALSVSDAGMVFEVVELPGGDRHATAGGTYRFVPGTGHLERLPAGDVRRIPGGPCAPTLSADGETLALCVDPGDGVALFDTPFGTARATVAGAADRVEGEYTKVISISADGMVVAFELRGLLPGDRWSSSDIYVVGR